MTGIRTLIGVPIDSIGRAGGTELTPAALRDAGVADALSARDAGDLDVRITGEQRDRDTGIVGYPSVVSSTEGIREGVRASLERGEFPIVLGGCCTLLPGVLRAFGDLGRRTAIAYLDGHYDLYTGVTSPTGEAADMPLAMLLGDGPPALIGDGPLVDAADVAVIGARDREEAVGLGSPMPEDVGIALDRDPDRVAAEGPAAVSAEVLDRLGAPIWVHLDVDVLTTEDFPATPYLQPGGMTADQVVEVVRPIVRSGRCAGIDVTCYDPDMDEDGSSARRLVELLGRILSDPGDDSGGDRPPAAGRPAAS
jgi:arginase